LSARQVGDHRQRERLQLLQRERLQLLQGVLDALGTAVATIDVGGRVLTVNRAWRQLVPEEPTAGVGRPYLALCASGWPCCPDSLPDELLARVLTGVREELRLEYPGQGCRSGRWYQLRATHLNLRGEGLAVLAHDDVTDLKAAEEQLRTLATEVLRAQDEERRRISRDLHDETGQQLYALLLALNRAATHRGRPGMDRLLAECESLAREALQQVRTVSYLLHPPLLDESGLAATLRWYVKGFSERSGILTTARVEAIDRLPAEVERALFRVVQEALTNVRRHARATTARVSLTRTDHEAVLVVRDDGRGLGIRSGRRSRGLGLASMQERIHELGGFLMIRSSGSGTEIRASVPLRAHALRSHRRSAHRHPDGARSPGELGAG
jgi:signal transduction histidine kinase